MATLTQQNTPAGTRIYWLNPGSRGELGTVTGWVGDCVGVEFDHGGSDIAPASFHSFTHLCATCELRPVAHTSGDAEHATECDDCAALHVNYPHNPGYLIDCEACENSCHCGPGVARGEETECVWEGHDDSTAREEDAELERYRARQLPKDIGPVFAQISDANIVGHISKRYDSLADAMSELENGAGRWHDYDGRGVALLSEPTAWVFLADPVGDADPYPDFTIELSDSGEALYNAA